MYSKYIISAVAILCSIACFGRQGEDAYDYLKWHYGYDEGEVKERCDEYDLLGGQPAITQEDVVAAKAWADKVLPLKSKYYLKEVPKTKLKRDYRSKECHDMLMKKVEKFRSFATSCYIQFKALGIDMSKFPDISAPYKKMMDSRDWKKICEYDKKVSYSAAERLDNEIRVNLHGQVSKAYEIVESYKKERFQKYATTHPEAHNRAIKVRNAKKALIQAEAAAFNRGFGNQSQPTDVLVSPGGWMGDGWQDDVYDPVARFNAERIINKKLNKKLNKK